MPENEDTSNISLHIATEVDLPALISLQATCFDHLFPSDPAAMLDAHSQHLRDDPGLRIVKAILSPSPDTSITIPDAANKKNQILVGFCMFYFPTILTTTATTNDNNPGPQKTIIQPIPLRPRSDHQPDPRLKLSSIPVERLKYRDNIILSTLQAQYPTLNVPDNKNDDDDDNAMASVLTTHQIGIGYVRFMSVHPSHRRRGIGAMLMKWATERYDAAGWDVYLEATVEGAALYRKWGFEKIGEYFARDEEGNVTRTDACMWRRARRDRF